MLGPLTFSPLSGHVFCEDCILRLDKERKCPVCRDEWGSRSPFKIYLNFPDPDKSTRILQHLDSINQDTPAVIVQKTGDIIKGLVGDPKVSMDDKKEVCLCALFATGAREMAVLTHWALSFGFYPT